MKKKVYILMLRVESVLRMYQLYYLVWVYCLEKDKCRIAGEIVEGYTQTTKRLPA